MPKAIELLRQGRREELWQMCCGFLSLDLEQFMAIQKRLLLEQLQRLNRSVLIKKLMPGARLETVADFLREAPLTTYADYTPELAEKKDDILPAKPAQWVHTSGRSGEYACKWVPITPEYAREMSTIMYGIGILASCRGWGDTSAMPELPKIVYTVAPRPYMSGAMATMLEEQTPTEFFPPLEEAETLSFEDRVKIGFRQALSGGLDFFFGLSIVLVAVGDKFSRSTEKVDIRPFLSQPSALLRLSKALAKSRIARRPILPRDIWSVKGIICSGLDSWVYRDKIKEQWGRYPLDIYASTEGGIIATQTWDHESMTFIPNLNFLEFIPEKEHIKWRLDHRYQPKTVLLDEVKAGENYEIVITNFHGGAMVRYRMGDMIKITSLKNEKLGINLPQMVFERRADDLLDFVVTRLTEKTIWQAIEKAGIPYVDWTAYKEPGQPVLKLLIEPKPGYQLDGKEIARAVYEPLLRADNDSYTTSHAHDDLADMINFKVEVTLLPPGSFAYYMSRRQAEGADLAHLKPAHVNAPPKVISLLLTETDQVATRNGVSTT